MAQQARVAVIGECMLELIPAQDRTFQLEFAGDTFNVALYLQRQCRSSSIAVSYVTALGDDPYSAEMLSTWQKEGLDVSLVRQLPNELPGLYLIRNAEDGERHFYYYRSQAAARQMFDGAAGDDLCASLLAFDVLYCSSISLAILPEAGREKLMCTLEAAHQKGALIAFDSNYRPRLWQSREEAQQVMERAWRCVDIALPSFSDEALAWGDASPRETDQRLSRLGVQERVIKQGEEGCLLSDQSGQAIIPVVPVERVIDTTAAGDAFNGAYLAARLQGQGSAEAAQKAAQLAARVIQHRGAILPLE